MDDFIFYGCECLTFPGVQACLTATDFEVSANARVVISVTALGYFQPFINGKLITENRLMPAMSDYEKRDLSKIHMPIYDELGHRIYYYEFDISDYVKEGCNRLSLHIGAGWYGQTKSLNEGMPFWGDNLAIFRIDITDRDGNTVCVRSSLENTVWKKSYILETQLYFGEYHDLRRLDENDLLPGYAPQDFAIPTVREIPCSLFMPADYPADRVISSVEPRIIHSFGDSNIYDLGTYCAGVPVIVFKDTARTNSMAVIRIADELNEDGSLKFHYTGGDSRMQRDFFLYDGRFEKKELYPVFTWHAGRYAEVTGEADLIRFDNVYTDVRQTAFFTSDSEILNKLFNAYILTQNLNIHGCVPSDCPHRERLGYTGDGQLTSAAVMTCFDAKNMYRKWLRDILDCQDRNNGHVQHTAPFYGGGGGPGGWGGAAVIVPFNYYLFYGDKSVLSEHYASMKAYLRYMTDHTEDGIVTHAEKGGWCLGDWCAPHNDIKIPNPFVNTCFLAKCAALTSETAKLLGFGQEAGYYLKMKENALDAINRHYFSNLTGSYCDGIQGADAFALDLGLGDERTRNNLIEKYDKLGTFDTGIFGTPLVIRQLFENGRGDIAFTLLTNTEESSFYNMFSHGAVTLWENWDGCDSRCHPMFGAVIEDLFLYVLGIRHTRNSDASGEIIVKPAVIPGLGYAKGSLVFDGKKITVTVRRSEDGTPEAEYETEDIR